MHRTIQNLLAQAGLLALCLLPAAARAQSSATPSLPTVNLGETSFLDGVAGPGLMVELFNQGVHDDRTVSNAGRQTPGTTSNNGSWLTHAVWISQHKLFGAWYGGEVLVPFAYVDAKAGGTQGGVGAPTVGAALQWPEKHLFGRSFQQRVLFDFDLPTGTYSDKAGALNIGNHAWTVHPYYAFTYQPVKGWETSWRIHYLWNSTNSDPVAAEGVRDTQAGQALHFNATLSRAVGKNLHLGANGYYLHQLTEAKVNGVAQPGTEIVGALGPGAMWQHGKWMYYANAYREFGGNDYTEGNKLVLRVEKVF